MSAIPHPENLTQAGRAALAASSGNGADRKRLAVVGSAMMAKAESHYRYTLEVLRVISDLPQEERFKILALATHMLQQLRVEEPE